MNLDSGIDYRLKSLNGQNTYFFVKSECDADQEANRIFKVNCYIRLWFVFYIMSFLDFTKL